MNIFRPCCACFVALGCASERAYRTLQLSMTPGAPRQRSIRFLLAAIPLMAIFSSARTTALAVTKNYVGPASGAGAVWSNAANWDPSGVPAGVDVAQITNSDAISREITIGANAGTANVIIGNSGGGTNTLTQLASVNFNLSSLTIGQSADAIGTFTQNGGANTYTGEAILIGGAANSTGTYNLNAGSITQTAARRSAINVGWSGTGHFNHAGGSVNISNGSLALGGKSTAVGNYNLSGSATLTVLGDESVGASGIGNFTQSGGTNTIGSATTNGNLNIAPSAGSTGTYTLSGGTLEVNGWAYVGGNASAGGTGVLNISGGTMTTTGTLKVWKQAIVSVSAGTLNAGAISLESGPGGSGGTLKLPLSFGSLAFLHGDVNSRYTGTITVAGPGSHYLDSGISASNSGRS